MPYLRVTARTIPLDARRALANELTEATLQLMPRERADGTTVHFTDLDPRRFATDGRLVIDGQMADVHLEFVAPQLPMSTRRALIDRFTGILANAYNIHGEDIYHVNIKFGTYDALSDHAMGGRFVGRYVPLRQRVLRSVVPALGTALFVGACAYLVNRFWRSLRHGGQHAFEYHEFGDTSPLDPQSQLPQPVLED